MKIAVDAMGGDDAPFEIVKGAVQASSDIKGKIILLGDQEVIKEELNKYNHQSDKLEIYHTSQVINMDDSPSRALRRKKDSSVVVGAQLVEQDKVDAFVSAGNTGAVMTASTLKIGRIEGVKRPAIATVFPGFRGETLVLDVGANADSKPEHLVQQAQMGHIYATEVLHKSNPKLGLLSIGEEKKKGNQLTKAVYPELEDIDNINFIGNVEGRDIFTGEYDIIVTDGFVGNVVLKTAEGLSSVILKSIKEEIESDLRSKIGGFLLEPALNRIKKKMDPTEYGGARLLGVDGITIIGHGSSNAKAIVNAIKTAEESIEVELIDLIKQNINEGTDS
ncbi:phosphate acyltransferase PlsX [Halanaerocella petrolearia]